MSKAMQNSSGDGNGQDSQHYSLNFPANPSSEFYHNLTSSSSSVSNIPGLLRLAPTSPMGGMPVVSSGIQTVAGASHGYVVPGGNALKRTAQEAGFSAQRQCEMPSSDDDNSISDKFSLPQTSVSPTDGQSKIPDSPVVKKTKGRVKIKMEFIDNKLRRYTTFSKRKTGIMKKVCPIVHRNFGCVKSLGCPNASPNIAQCHHGAPVVCKLN